ncbi:MAG: hypothetical protein NZM44_05910 [Candidatus Calescibacterium sp.]|nr:hypothetical protein [Candidatus Calescibacterium sp.]
MMLKCSYYHISIPKIGNCFEENEDNLLIPSKSDIENESVIKFAISDGATESSFAKEWSDLLVCCYKDKPFDLDNLNSTIQTISEMWYSRISTIELPWYAQEKVVQGAFAAFLGLTINFIENTFEAISIGDCNLFQIRENKLFCSFPLSNPEEFGNTPALFASNMKYQTNLEETVKYLQGNIKQKDIFILSTDSLAVWLLKEMQNNRKPWKRLFNLLRENKKKEDVFTKWIRGKVEKRIIRNDDISVIIVEIN